MQLQDYHHDSLSRIVSGDTIFSKVIDADSYFHDLDGKSFKMSKVDHVRRSMHLDISDLERAFQDISRRLTRIVRRVLRWIKDSELSPRMTGASQGKVN